MNIFFKSRTAAGSRLAVLLVVPVVILSVILARETELRITVPLLVGTTAGMTIAMISALYFGERYTFNWSPVTILVVAFMLRLLFLFAPPQLSDDIYRYLWDGSNLITGVNPYATAPAATAPSPALLPVHSRINHPDFVTIYPPMAQLIFGGGAALGGTITGMKLLLVMIDMGLCLLIIAVVKKLELPAGRAVLYAWNPLPVLEIAGSGHIDGAGMAFLLAAVYLMFPDREHRTGTALQCRPFLLSGALLACAGMVKLLPFVFAPLVLILVPAGMRRYFIAGGIGTVTLLTALFLPDLSHMASSLDVYAQNWEFAGLVFTILRGLAGSGRLPRLLLSISFLLIVCVFTYRLAHRCKRTETFHTRALQTLKACYAISMAFLLMTPTLQPWYALTLAAFLPFCGGPAGLVLCWAVFLTYQVQIPYFILGQWQENPLVTAAVFLAPVSAYLLRKGICNTFPQDMSGHPL